MPAEPFQETLTRLDEWIQKRKETVSPRTDQQQKVDRWRERLRADPVKAMRDTERMLWAIHDQKRELDTSDPSGVGGFQLYTWVMFMVAARRTREPLYAWVMQALDARKRSIGMVRTSEGWLPLGAVLPHGQNHLVPIDKITEFNGDEVYVLAHKAVPSEKGGGVRLVSFHPDLTRDREATLAARFQKETIGDVESGTPRGATGPDGPGEAGDPAYRQVTLTQFGHGGVQRGDAPQSAGDVSARIVREAIERVVGRGGSGADEPGDVGGDEDDD